MTLTTEIFIDRAREIHNDLYDYSEVRYQRWNKKVCILDPEYGKFWQRPNDHTNGQGHPHRADQSRRLTSDQFIQKADQVHNKLYDYSKIVYTGYYDKVCIMDPIHGEFWQTPSSHLYGRGNRERSCHKENSVHRDHIIPLTIIGGRSVANKRRPLYNFLNSNQNVQLISGAKNLEKSDWVVYKGKNIRARHAKNDYKVIAYLAEKLLDINIDTIIAEDKKFMQS